MDGDGETRVCARARTRRRRDNFFRFLKKERSAESGRPVKIIWTCLQEQKSGDLDMAHPQ